MINIIIGGRLGNQMFRYAMARAYMIKNNLNEINMNFDNVYESNFKNELKFFKIIEYNENKIKLSLIQHIILLYIKMNEKFIDIFCSNEKSIKKNIFEKKIQKWINKHGVIFLTQGYQDFSYYKKNMYIEGNFESSKYFDEYKKIIQEEFTPKYDKLPKNEKLYKKIETSNSVCITIRRGDFLSEKNIKAHYVCTPEYFDKAIKKICTMIKNPHFFVFSDDIKWVKQNMNFPGEVDYEDGTDPVWEKIRLMYSCRHFIISNSTFSWWAQYLSRNDDKIVIAPSRWKNTFQNNDIYSEDWILIDV